MMAGTVPACWLAITGVWTAEANLALLKAVDEAGMPHGDLEGVQTIWNALQARNAVRHAELRAAGRRARMEARARAEEMRGIEQRAPGVQNRTC